MTPSTSPAATYTVSIYAKRSHAAGGQSFLYYGINDQTGPSGGVELTGVTGALRYTLTNVAHGSIIYIGMTDVSSSPGAGNSIYPICTQIAANSYCSTWVCEVASVEITANTDISVQARINLDVCGTWP
jgi:hypothetical protein